MNAVPGQAMSSQVVLLGKECLVAIRKLRGLTQKQAELLLTQMRDYAYDSVVFFLLLDW